MIWIIVAAWTLVALFVSRYISYWFAKCGMWCRKSDGSRCEKCNHASRHSYSGVECWKCGCQYGAARTLPICSKCTGWAIVTAVFTSLIAWPVFVGVWTMRSLGKKTEFQSWFVSTPPRVESKTEKITRLEREAKEREKTRIEYEKETNRRLRAAGINPEALV